MGKKLTLIILSILLILVLTGCQPQTPQFAEATKIPDPTPTVAPLVPTEPDEPDFDGGEYDPTSEENNDEDIIIPDDVAIPVATDVAFITSEYAGATPIILDPIDKPTGTPRPEITFQYQTYTASSLGVTFEAPAGWSVDDSVVGTLVLTEPADEQKDNYTATLTISAEPSGGEMSTSDMKAAVKALVSAVGETNYKEWKVTEVGTRTLMDGDGVYQDYRGVLLDGTIVRGRMHIACIDRTLYTIHLSHPGWYNSDFLNIHAQLRKTMKLIN